MVADTAQINADKQVFISAHQRFNRRTSAFASARGSASLEVIPKSNSTPSTQWRGKQLGSKLKQYGERYYSLFCFVRDPPQGGFLIRV